MPSKVEWAYWLKLPEVKVFEAIALLNDTEPGSEPPDSYSASPEYRKTLRLLLACLPDRSTFSPGTLNMGDPALNGVRLREVGAWAIASNYTLPEMFPRPVEENKATNIEWAFWKAMRTVKLWQACALMVGIDPDKLKLHPQSWMVGAGAAPLFDSKCFPSPDGKARFDKALRLAANAVSYMNGPIFPKGQPHPGNNSGKEVSLSEVAAFFISFDWPDIPAPLQSIANASQPAIEQEPIASKIPAAVAVIPKQRAQEARILELLNAQGYSPLSLEPRAPGKPGPKAEIRTLAMNDRKLFTAKSFDTAWQRLRDAKEIAGAE